MGSTYLSNFLFSSFTWCGIGTVLSCSYFYYHISFLSPYIYRFYVTYLYIPRHRLHTIFSLTIFPSTCPTIHLLSLSLHHPLPTSVSISFPCSHYLSGSFFSLSLLLVREQRSSCRRHLDLSCATAPTPPLSSESPPFIVFHFQLLLSTHFPFRFHVFLLYIVRFQPLRLSVV